MTAEGDRALARRALRDGRTRMASFALLFALVAYANAAGYSGAYPTLKDRLAFAHSFAGNGMFRLFYGVAHALPSGGGAAALRGEEDAGRTELVLAGSVSRPRAYAATILAV